MQRRGLAKPASKSLKKFTLLTAAAYFFMFAVCAKGVYFYANQHPVKEKLLSVHGTVGDVRLGGEGKATTLQIESEFGTHRYSSYYGKVWPGMERIQPGDPIDLLAERSRLNPNEFVTGKRYYIWELVHRQQIVFSYEDVREMVQGKEAAIGRYINIWLIVGLIFLFVMYFRKMRSRYL